MSAHQTTATSKRNFLRGRNPGWRALRPPWSLDEMLFTETCNRCGQCADKCPLNIIKMGDAGFPEMDFSLSGCDFCRQCVNVCESAAISSQVDTAFKLIASINDQCFAVRAVICRSCAEVCETGALKFKQVVGGISQVLLDNSACTGCGECVSICPADSISMKTTR